MALPNNGIFVVKGEMTILMTAIKRGVRWQSHSLDEETDNLMKNFQELKTILIKIDDLKLIEPDVFLTPFLNVIRSEETSGPVTSLALAAINKFLSYGLIDPTHTNVPRTVYNIADAVTHAKFIGTDQSSDGVVLMRVLQVLRTLTLAPEGATLTNESLCEIMLTCFRICFESRIHELLRKTAEHYLKDMVQLVFMRLPQFSDDIRASSGTRQFKFRAGIEHNNNKSSKKRSRHSFRKRSIEKDILDDSTKANVQTALESVVNNFVDPQEEVLQDTISQTLSTDCEETKNASETIPNESIEQHSNEKEKLLDSDFDSLQISEQGKYIFMLL